MKVGKPWVHPKEAAPSAAYAQFNSQSPQRSAEAAALAQARLTGRPVVVRSLTTGTSLETAEPNGTLSAATTMLPVRVRTGAGWVPVDTRLRLSRGRLSATAVPGDSVSFSAGGTGPAADISSGGSSLRLWWPAALPGPSVSGSSATYSNVLPGVNLVLTAVSGHSGGFREVLVVTSRKAAGDTGLASLAWRISVPGTSGLRSLPDGGLLAQAGPAHGFVALPPVMWDSSTLALAAPAAAVRVARSEALAAGATLAVNGLGAASTVAGPARGARESVVGTRLSGGVLSLAPDAALLSQPSTQFPVFIDPTFTSYDDTSGTQAYDTVQSGSGCTGPQYHTTISTTADSPVGFDNFQAGNCQTNDTDYTLYRLGIPSGALSSQGHLLQASLQIREDYSSDCTSTATMTATWVGGISKGTGWPGPGKEAGDENATAKLGPDTYTDSLGNKVSSCNGVFIVNDGATVGTGFNVTTDLSKAGLGATDITFRVWEDPANNTADSTYPSQPSQVLHRQLTVNPTLEVHWIYSPNKPSDLEQASNNSGANSLDCSTSSTSLPRIGKTIAQGGVYLLSTLTEPTHSGQNPPGISYNVRYATGTSTSPTWTTVSDVQSGANGVGVSYKLPTSVTSGSGVTDGTVIQWEAQADIGTTTLGSTTYGPFTSAWTQPCYFAVYPTAPDPPDLHANFTQTSPQTLGSTVTFTITETTKDSTSEFVWGQDALPPTTGTIPASKICSATTTTYCTALAKNSSGYWYATLSLPVSAPGPHDVWVYEKDLAGNLSAMTNGAPTGQNVTYLGAGDPAVSYNPPGSSLQANFTAAMTDTTHSFGNRMISTVAGKAGTANADGQGNALDQKQLTDAGWASGGTVTIDGATFTLPPFATSSGPDNLLAANQVLGAGGAHGSALVFLATSTHGNVALSGTIGSGSDEGDAVLAGDVTAPVTPGGFPVTGAGCGFEASYDATVGCGPAKGTITYASGCTDPSGNPVLSTSYTLTVGDWVKGAYQTPALTLTSRVNGSGADTAIPNLYVSAVPIPASCGVASVSLPDVGTTLAAANLHILGITLRNTTTSTPAAGGAIAAPSGRGWTGAVASAIDNAFSPPPGKIWGNQTVRIAVSPGVTAPASTTTSPVYVRIRLSDPGFWSSDGTGPLQIGAATIAPQSSPGSPGASQAPTVLKFSGSTSVKIPEGGDIYSDPIALPFAVTPGSGILVSLYLKNASLPVLPLNNNSSGAEAWFAPTATPDETGVQAGTVFTSGGGYAMATVPVLTGVDVTTPPPAGITPAPPGEPTVVVTGDGGIIDGESSTSPAIPSDSGNDPSQRLAGQLVSQGYATGFGVVDTSVEDNGVTGAAVNNARGGFSGGGLQLEYRLDHDLLAEPDLGTVVINVGMEDVLNIDGLASGTPLMNVIGAGVKDTARLLFASGFVTQGPGVTTTGGAGIVIGQLTPCYGYLNNLTGNFCDTNADGGRATVNGWISAISGIACEAFFNSAVSQPGSNPNTLQTAFDDGDHVNLTLGSSGGYAALAPMVSNCNGFAYPLYPFPSN